MKKAAIIIVILGAVLIGYIARDNFSVWRLPRNENPVDGAVESQPGWKKYTFEQHPFSFTYPSDWVATELEPGVVVLMKGLTADLSRGSISINVAGELPYKQALQEIQSGFPKSAPEALRIGTLSGVQFSGSLPPESEGEEPRQVIFSMIDYGGRLVSVDFMGGTRELEEMRETYLQVVNSLKLQEAGTL